MMNAQRQITQWQYQHSNSTNSDIRKDFPLSKQVKYTKNPCNSILKKNFGIDSHRYKDLVEHLSQGDHSLIKQLFLCHYQDCIAYLMTNHNCTIQDAYDITMETLLLFRTKLIEGKIEYGNLRYLFTKIAIHQLYDKRQRDKKQESIKEKLELIPSHEQIIMKQDEILLLHLSITSVCEKCRFLLYQYYFKNITLTEIALSIGKKPASIRKQKERCMHRLTRIYNQLSLRY